MAGTDLTGSSVRKSGVRPWHLVAASSPGGRRGDAALRVLAAIPVAYLLSALWAMALARIIPGAHAMATVAATLSAFAVCAAAAMWAYAARSGWRALWTLLAISAVAGGAWWASFAVTGRW